MKECRRAARLGVIIALVACGPLGCGENGNDDTGVQPGDGDGEKDDAGQQPGDGDGDGDGDEQPGDSGTGGEGFDASTPVDAGSEEIDSGSSGLDSGASGDSGTGGDGDGDDASVQADASVGDAGTSADSGSSEDDAGPSCQAPDPIVGPAGLNRALSAVALGPEGCDSPGGEQPAKLNDDSNGSKWLCRKSNPAISLAFNGGASYAVDTYQLTSGNDAPERDPKNWSLQGSNDGASWVTVDQRTNQGFTARGQTRTFYFVNCQAFARYRLVIEANNGADIFQLAELRLYGKAGASLPKSKAVGGTVTSDCPNTANSAEDATAAFDGNPGSKWFCGGKSAVTVSYDFKDEEAYAITSYSVTAGNDSSDRDPKTWTVEGSDDGATWTPLEPAQTDQVFAERYQTTTFPLDNTTAYKQYRIVITSNNGSTDFQVADFGLFE